MKETILSIAGRPGLYRLVARGRATLIVESLDAARRRFPVGARDRVTSLSDVSIYTNGEEDAPLMQVFQNIKDADGIPAELDARKAASDELAAFMERVLPEYDRDRVHDSDIRKLIQWYMLLAQAGVVDFVEKKPEAEA